MAFTLCGKIKLPLQGPYQWIADGTGFFPQNAHSSWLDVTLQLGLPGLVLLAALHGYGLAGDLIATAAWRPRRSICNQRLGDPHDDFLYRKHTGVEHGHALDARHAYCCQVDAGTRFPRPDPVSQALSN
jgi:hypothetical protein